MALPALFLSVAASGCSLLPGPPESRVATSINALAFYEARYQEACVVVVGPAACDTEDRLLMAWRGRLDDALVALERTKKGGKLPLQLRELKRIEKETRKCRPR